MTVTVTGKYSSDFQDAVALCSTVVASQEAIDLFHMVNKNGVTEVSRDSCGFALHSSSRSSCSPRVIALPEVLNCGK